MSTTYTNPRLHHVEVRENAAILQGMKLCVQVKMYGCQHEDMCFRKLGRGRMLKVDAAVEMQLAVHCKK